MKKTWQIAKLELSLLFYSPIAWLLMIVLFFSMALGFVNMADGFQRAADYRNVFRFLTKIFFTSPSSGGIFNNIVSSLYLYIPLITMGIISRETGSGTIKLLYSSPITIRQIILGKFLSMMVYSFILMLLFSIFVIGGFFTIINLDWPHILGALLALYLLLCAYSAIGIFMSSLTTYQVVAAISTFVVFSILNYIGLFGQGMDYIRDLTHSLSMPGRTEKLIAGLLTTRDVCYFLALVYIFLALTIGKLKMERDSKSKMFRAGVYMFIVCSGLLITYLTSRPRYIGYWDVTDTKENTIRKNTQEILQKMGDDKIEITQYVNFLDEKYGFATPYERLKDWDRWEPYLRFKPNIDLKWVYYYKGYPELFRDEFSQGKTINELIRIRAKFFDVDSSGLLKPEEIDKMVDLSKEGRRIVMQVKYKGKKIFLRTFEDPIFWPSETEIAAAFKRLLVKIPKVLFVNGDYERSIDRMGDRDYKLVTSLQTFRYALVNQGFDVDSFDLKTKTIPPDIAALVIADPRVIYDTATQAKLQRYIEKGGNLMIAGEPGKQMIGNQLLNPLGIKLMDGSIVQRSRDYSFSLTTPYLTAPAVAIGPILKEPRQDSIPVSMPGATGLAFDSNSSPFRSESLLLTDEKHSWSKKGIFVVDSADLVFEPLNGDEHGAFPTALALTRNMNGKEQRIVVTGDADFMSNGELMRSNLSNSNFLFNNAVFGWFAYGEFPINTTRPRSKDTKILIGKTGARVIMIVYKGVIPGLMLLIGAMLLIRRKRK